MIKLFHDVLPNGIECGVAEAAGRHVVSFQVRVLAGHVNEPVDRLGLARIVEGTIDKGTPKRSAQELSDAFDDIGAVRGAGSGRETTTFTCTVLPEHLDRALELHAEMLRTPTLPSKAVEVNVELARQELTALQDDPQGLVEKHITPRAYGPVLGRHPLGEPTTLNHITRSDVEQFWKAHYHNGRIVAVFAGPVGPNAAADLLGRHFDGFGERRAQGREAHEFIFTPGRTHVIKALEQQQMAICWPGVDATHLDFPVQQVALGILSGGMSGRLFTEVREKRGLVYWVSAWQDTPRGVGMMFLGASTTPDRCDETYATMLREVDRLSEDIEDDELRRAVTGLVAAHDTRGDSTRARCVEIGNDLFFFGRPIPLEEKVAKLEAVTINDVRRYLAEHRRDQLCVLTLGPRPLSASGCVSPAAVEAAQ